jgi:hypothetical protein
MKLYAEIEHRNTLLARFGIISFLCLIILVPVSVIDKSQIMGINSWIKPMKFFLSVGIFAWTMAWLLYYLDQQKQVRIISKVIVVVMSLELVLISLQAARGETSHYNISSLFNGIVFQTMGIAIIINTAIVFWTFLLFRKENKLPKGYKLGIQLGLFIFVLASLEGFTMISKMAHTVGAPDGVEGYYFLNWAKQYGDLRIAHFLGLHAIQIVPLFAWYFARNKPLRVAVFGILFFFLSFVTFWKALQGLPII